MTNDSSLHFSGGVVLYATELSGSLLGIPITLTPGNAVTVLLKLLNSLTPLVPVTMTNVTTDDFLEPGTASRRTTSTSSRDDVRQAPGAGGVIGHIPL